MALKKAKTNSAMEVESQADPITLKTDKRVAPSLGNGGRRVSGWKCLKSIPPICHENIFDFMANRNGGVCPIAREHGEFARPEDLHHAGMPNTKTNRRLYPYVIHSMLNLQPVNHQWHMAHGRWGQRKGFLWAERYQRFLEKPCHERARLFVNGVLPRFFL